MLLFVCFLFLEDVVICLKKIGIFVVVFFFSVVFFSFVWWILICSK